MTLIEYFELVQSKIEQNDYKIKRQPYLKGKEIKISDPYLESINYILYEYMKDRNDLRYKDIFDYIVVPNDADPLFDFNNIPFEEFFQFLIDIKDTK